ncbi:TPA: hypothetical protein ACOEGF_001737 [Enterobacter asburiae]
MKIIKQEVQAIADLKAGYTLGHADVAILNELARIALASLEAEPVAYVDPFAFNNFSVYRAGETDNKCMGREWMWANPDAGLIPVYTAPPEPVSVPDEMTMQKALSEIDRLSWQECTRDAYMLGWNACRAAMLQGAAGNSPAVPECSCHTCLPVTFADSRFVVCPECGNKRCPHVNDHRNSCTGSNEPGQEGSAYPAAPQKEVK